MASRHLFTAGLVLASCMTQSVQSQTKPRVVDPLPPRNLTEPVMPLPTATPTPVATPTKTLPAAMSPMPKHAPVAPTPPKAAKGITEKGIK